MVLDDEMLDVKQYFNTNHIKLSDCWLENCTEWFRQNNSSYTQKQMLMKIYEQWLLLDLRQVDISILPANINSVKKMVLTEIYSLQLMQFVDISKPKLHQLQKIRNSKMLEHANETDYSLNTKRMLQLTLSDGVQEVKAIEYNIIKSLHKDLAPGTKIQVKGPITVRRGQILLEKEESLKLLGGEVEELLVANAYENVLAKNLNLRINLEPVPINERIDNNVVIAQKKVSKDLKSGRNLDNPNERNKMNLNQESSIVLNKKLCINVKNGGNVAISNDTNGMHLKDELLLDNKSIELLEMDNECKNKRRKMSRSPDLFDDDDIDDEVFKNINVSANFLNKPSTSNVGIVNQIATNWDNAFDDIIDDKLFEDIKIDVQPEKEYITITLLKDYIDKKKYGKHKIKAKFKNILEKLTVNDSMWYMKIKIEDETDSIDTLMHDEIITELIGYSSSEMMKLKTSVVNKDKTMIDTIYKAIGEFRNKVLDIDCIMEIMYNQIIETPVIIKLFGK